MLLDSVGLVSVIPTERGIAVRGISDDASSLSYRSGSYSFLAILALSPIEVVPF